MRIKNLDVLRTVAVVLVLGQHFEINALWSKIGWFGVDLFFVLSGFLVSGLLFSEYKTYGKIRALNFYARRGLKIYPAFYTLMAFTIIWQLFIVHELPMRNLLAELLFYQNYVYGFWWHTWSLAVEEHFYFLLPITLLVMIKMSSAKSADPFRHIPKLFLVIAVLLLTGRLLTLVLGGDNYRYAVGFSTHLRIDSLFFGVTLSYYRHFRSDIYDRISNHRLLPVIAAISITACVVFSSVSMFMLSIGLCILYIGFGCILLISLRERAAAQNRIISKIVSIVAGIGFYSYSIYLWHMAMKDWGLRAIRYALKRIDIPFLSSLYERMDYLIYIFGSIVLGIVMAKLVELPVLKLRDRIFPSRSKSLVKPAGERVMQRPEMPALEYAPELQGQTNRP